MAKRSAKPTALLAVCIYRYLEPSTMVCIEKAVATGRYVLLRYYNDALICRARSMAASDFLRQYRKLDVLVFVDADMVFTPEDLDRVVALARQKKAVAGGGYPIRRAQEGWPAVRLLDGDAEPLTFGPEQPPRKVRYAGTGFLAIHRRVLEKLVKAQPFCTASVTTGFWPIFQPFPFQHPNGEWEYLGEDWAFSQRVYQAGLECWMDMSLDIGHMGSYQYRLADVAQRLDNDDERKLVLRDLAAYWEKPLAEVILTLQNSENPNETIAKAWRERVPETPEEVDQFYGGQEAYIADLVLWNTSPQFWHDITVLLRCRGRVADFGGGIGSLALALARRGAKVFYVDLPSPQRSFAEWRFKQHAGWAGEIGVHTSLGELEKLDVIVSNDTMEHLHPETLPLYAKQMFDALRPGGQVRAVNRFGNHAGQPMHYDSGDMFMEAMKGAGFEGGPVVWAKPAVPG